METVSREEFFENYNTDSKEHDVLNYWPSKSATDEKYKRLTMFLIQNDVFIDMIDAFIKLMSYDAHDELIEYVLNKIEKQQSVEAYQILMYTSIRKHKLEYIKKIKKMFPCFNEENENFVLSLDKKLILSNYFGNCGSFYQRGNFHESSPFRFFVTEIINCKGSNGRLNCKILKQNVTENDKKIFKLVYSNSMRDVEQKIQFIYQYDKHLKEGIVLHLCKMYKICADNVLTREARRIRGN